MLPDDYITGEGPASTTYMKLASVYLIPGNVWARDGNPIFRGYIYIVAVVDLVSGGYM